MFDKIKSLCKGVAVVIASFLSYVFKPNSWFQQKQDEIQANAVVTRKWKIKRKASAETTAPPPAPIVSDKPIEYVLNDSSSPDLIKQVTPPEPYDLVKYLVKDYEGGGHPRMSDKGHSANAFVTITNTLNMVKRYAEAPFTAWPGTSILAVLPLAGVDFNAFYNRKSMQFFYAYDPVDNKPIYTADSADIVSHELGHAILDAYRPDTWGVASLEVWSFHEAWADLIAMLSIMQHEEVLQKALVENGGDLNVDSVFTRLAEEMGRAIWNITGGEEGRTPDCLRSTINSFKYVNPGTLPEEARNDQLAAECHSFGRIFLGAFYDILVVMYKDGLTQGMTPLQALCHARDTLGTYVFKAIKHAPLNMRFFQSVAKTMLWIDWNLPNRPYHDSMKNIFLNRNIITREMRILSAPAPDTDGDGIRTSGQASVPMILSHHMMRAQGQDDNQLYDVEAMTAQEEAYLYDKETGMAIDFISISNEEVLGALQDTIMFLHKSRNVTNDESTPFEVVDGKLVRTHFS